MSIYHWKLGDIALARISKKVYAKIQVVKDENGLFHDDKVLGISVNEDGSLRLTEELCYYVEIIRSKERFWLPYTSLHLAARGRPFYGPINKVSPPKPAVPTVPRKRKILEEHILPMNVKPTKHKEPDLNIKYDLTHMPLKQGVNENAFKAFVRRGKENIFDEYFSLLQQNVDYYADSLDYLWNVDASTEDKFEMALKGFVTEKEVENFLHQCWRYNHVQKQVERDGPDHSRSPTESKLPITLHTTWCIVCGKTDRLRVCPACPSSFHLACRKDWLLTIVHRKNPPLKPQKRETLVKKILSSTRTICTVSKDKENVQLCPSCMWGPRVGYDDVVWHKLGTCSWWPARVLSPGQTPSCLLSRQHLANQWPLRYYGTLNHSWGDSSRMSLFLPSHTAALQTARDEMLKQAVLEACDDYIAVYLT